MKQSVLVAISGGVDSSVAAALLLEQGYEVQALTFCLDSPSPCSLPVAGDVVKDSAAVCKHLGIKHHIMDLREEFRERVQQDFVANYLQARTPNPCVICNQRIKWNFLQQKADELGVSHLATGHYVRVVHKSGVTQLLRGVEERKDQSYALWRLSAAALSRTLMPLGELSKAEVRALAEQMALPVARKGESQDICFIPDGEYRRFLQEYAPEEMARIEAGDILSPEGKVIGRHQGLPYYTVGQRRGLGVALGQPVYVVELDAEKNQLKLAYEEGLRRSVLVARDTNWLIEEPSWPLHCLAAIRYHDRGAPACVESLADGSLRVRFEQPRRAIAPGQSVVFYQGERLLGGGLIWQCEE